jgi:hypothetical protein
MKKYKIITPNNNVVNVECNEVVQQGSTTVFFDKYNDILLIAPEGSLVFIIAECITWIK